MTTQPTIAAIATPQGYGGIGVIRISGSEVKACMRDWFGHVLPARHASYQQFRTEEGVTIDQGLALYFPAPHSFTGEDVLEIQAHGGPVVLDQLLQRCLRFAISLARPGEFSERAFLNKKMDLAQAEAIMDLIHAGSAQAARSAMNTLQGQFSTAVHALAQAICHLRIQIEASIDFSAEALELIAKQRQQQALAALHQSYDALLKKTQQGVVLRDGISVVIAGAPNAGKSTLLNQLTGEDTAIVTQQAGTTRDILRSRITIDGLPIHLLDTAGLRSYTNDPIEQAGIAKAKEAIQQADHLLFITDLVQGNLPHPPDFFAKLIGPKVNLPPTTLVYNKIDLVTAETTKDKGVLYISAKTGQGIDTLKQRLKEIAGYHPEPGSFTARRRHLTALHQTKAALCRADIHCDNDCIELFAEELRQAHDALGQITGTVSSDELLGEIFSHFCIGK